MDYIILNVPKWYFVVHYLLAAIVGWNLIWQEENWIKANVKMIIPVVLLIGATAVVYTGFRV